MIGRKAIIAVIKIKIISEMQVDKMILQILFLLKGLSISK